MSLGLSAQTTEITGLVQDEEGETLIGALVKVVGNEKTVSVTDIDGKFTMSVPAGSQKVEVSYMGMTTQEYKIQPYMKIVMKADSKLLTEVVVTGMNKVDKRLFTGATDKIDADKAKLDGVMDVSRAIEGRSAGVSVQNISGTFGTAPKINVRGATSILGNSKPLWVVDGIIIEDAGDISSDALSSGNAETLISSAISGLNADDIESFQVLKDGSATSIYGARAKSGVIVITTKKGKMGTSKLSYTGEFTTRLIPSYKEFSILDSREQMGVYLEMDGKSMLEFQTLAQSSNYGVFGKMYNLMNTPILNSSGQVIGYELPLSERNNYLRMAESRNTDWFEELFNSNINQNHSVSMSSGTDKSRFYASLSLFNDPGWYKQSSVERYTANMNSTYYIRPTLSLNTLGNASYRKQNAPGTIGAESEVVSGQVKRDFDINPYSYALNSSRVLSPTESYRSNYTDFNILHELDNNYMDIEVVDLKFQGELNWKPVKGLDINFLSALRYHTSAIDHHIKDNSNMANAYRAGVIPEDPVIRDRNPFLYRDPENPTELPQTVLEHGGIYNRTAITIQGLDFRASATYNTTIDDTHILNFYGGSEINKTDRNRVWFRGWGYQYDNGGNPYYDYLVIKQTQMEGGTYYTNSRTYNRIASFFGQAIYSYKGRYTFNTGGRYEGTNLLGKSRDSRWLPTWSVSGAWSAHEESWFNNAFGNVLTHGSLKLSYSLTADAPPVSNALPEFHSYLPWRPTEDVREGGLYLVQGNDDLTYEKKHEINIGTSLGFLNNRINLEVDVFKRDNFDLIGLVYPDGTRGELAEYANVAEMTSKGIEISLATRNIQTKDFSWNTDFIFSNITTKITKLKSFAGVFDMISGSGFAMEGYPHRGIFSIPFVGLNEDGLPQFINEKGEVTVHDIDFQNFSNFDYLKYEGPSDPTIIGSFGNTFGYKNLKLNAFITYSFGNKIRLNPVFSAQYSDLTAMTKEFKNRWMQPGDENYTNVPVIASKRQLQEYGANYLQKAYSAYNYSTERIADGGFIRLKEISLSYDFPQKIITSFAESVQLKLQATNLFLLYSDDKLNGQDPEFLNTGGVASPMPKQFTLTVRLGF